MVTCDAARDELALDPTTQNAAVQSHVQTCIACAAYYRRHVALDEVIRTELHWDVPADLTARLLAITRTPAAFAAPVALRPKRWHVALAYLAATVSIVLSLLIGWQLVSLVAAQFDFQVVITNVMAFPGEALAWLTQALPESRYAVDFFLHARSQLVWLLLVALVWAMLDKWNPQLPTFRRRQSA